MQHCTASHFASFIFHYDRPSALFLLGTTAEAISTEAPPTIQSAVPVGANRTSAPLSPAVRILLETHHLDSRLIPSTGRGGRILKGDVLRFLDQGGTVAKKPAPVVPVFTPETSPTPTTLQPSSAGILLQNDKLL